MTVLGTRPEIIRLSKIIKLLDKYSRHTLVHTDQNFDKNLNDIFFSEFELRKPDLVLDSSSKTPMEQVGKILIGAEAAMRKYRPDRLLLLGDTNSALTAIAAKRLGIKVYHMEAGNRCYDDRVPEEVNRRVIDHSSDILMPYTERSRQNLLREGIPGERIFVTGNPIKEVLDYYSKQINESKILSKLKLTPKKYFLATLHREENVDDPKRLAQFVDAYNKLVMRYNLPLIWSVHPRTRKRLQKIKVKLNKKIQAVKPFGLFDFVHLEKSAFCVLSDSGTVQEECSIFNIPNVTTRDVTERPETLEAGSNFLSGGSTEFIISGVKIATAKKYDWQPPREYLSNNVSNTVIKIVLGYLHK